MVDREAVIWLYRLLHLREPESEEMIESHCRLPDIPSLVLAGLASDEFRNNFVLHLVQAQFARREPWVWAEAKEGFLLRVNLADHHVSWGAITGSFEPDETAFVTGCLRPGSIVCDIGANLGYYTMLAATLVGERGHVYSFEPMPLLFDSLQRSIARNSFGERVTAFNVALADRKGEAALQYAAHSDNWGGASLSFEDLLPGHATETVPIEPLTVLLDVDRLDFIKIDVEGAEFIALSAAADLLQRLRPTILSEIHPGQLARVSRCTPDDYLRLMGSLGYQCHRLAAGGTIGPELEIGGIEGLVNVVFLPRPAPDY